MSSVGFACVCISLLEFLKKVSVSFTYRENHKFNLKILE